MRSPGFGGDMNPGVLRFSTFDEWANVYALDLFILEIMWHNMLKMWIAELLGLEEM
ncbi:hypothetical protein KSZ_77710 [Dictyobacter formicarum]|uniref:Uncharacterized protein n=1 Tax=Dictyobacter formicarum TaxID=2778368 RepID=A0ABQ3VUV4_9CHLR|nr:hypothetical protein KSZ_77710 [Dictyobacter formicarum]